MQNSTIFHRAVLAMLACVLCGTRVLAQEKPVEEAGASQSPLATAPDVKSDKPATSTAAKPDAEAKLTDAIKALASSVVTITRVDLNTGLPTPNPNAQAGFIFDSRGYILTVSSDFNVESDQFKVRLANLQEFAAKVEGVDEALQLFILKINSPQTLPAISLTKIGHPKVGDSAFVVTSPVTKGLISGRVTATSVKLKETDQIQVIQTDHKLPLGEGGSLLVSELGEPIGIPFATRTGEQPVCFSKPLKDVQAFVQSTTNPKFRAPVGTPPVPAVDATMPDISGKWRTRRWLSDNRQELNVVEIIRSATEPEVFDLRPVQRKPAEGQEVLKIPLKWVSGTRKFEGTFKNDKMTQQYSLQLARGGQTLRVTVKYDEATTKEFATRGLSESDIDELLNQEWTRIPAPVEALSDSGFATSDAATPTSAKRDSESKIPDITGTWQYERVYLSVGEKGDELGIRSVTAIVTRIEGNDSEFEVRERLETGESRWVVKWWPENRRFESRIPTTDKTMEITTALQPLAGGRTIQASFYLDPKSIEKVEFFNPSAELTKFLTPIWKRVQSTEEKSSNATADANATTYDSSDRASSPTGTQTKMTDIVGTWSRAESGTLSKLTIWPIQNHGWMFFVEGADCNGLWEWSEAESNYRGYFTFDVLGSRTVRASLSDGAEEAKYFHFQPFDDQRKQLLRSDFAKTERELNAKLHCGWTRVATPAQPQPMPTVAVVKTEIEPLKVRELLRAKYREKPYRFFSNDTFRSVIVVAPAEAQEEIEAVLHKLDDPAAHPPNNQAAVPNVSREIPNGMGVVTVPVDSTKTFLAGLRPGDRVDVLATTRATGSETSETKTILEKIEVFAVDIAHKAESLDVKKVSLLVTPEQQVQIVQATDKVSIRLALRNPNDATGMTKAADPKMPDISGKWVVGKDGQRIREIRRIEDGVAGFVLVMTPRRAGASGELRLKWHTNNRYFDGNTPSLDSKRLFITRLVPAEDGRTLDVIYTFDEESMKELRLTQPDLKWVRREEWTRQDAKAPVAADAPPDAVNVAQDVPKGSEVKVFSLANASAEECGRLLKELFPKTNISVDQRTNSVIAAGDKEELGVIEAVLLRLDETSTSPKPVGPKEPQTTVINLKNGSVVEAQRFLTALGLVARIVPEPPNSLMVQYGTNEQLQQAKDFLKRLDEVEHSKFDDHREPKSSVTKFNSIGQPGPTHLPYAPPAGLKSKSAETSSPPTDVRIEGLKSRSNSPEARKLAEYVAEHEALARLLADQIRSLSQQLGPKHPKLVETRRKLDETLANALAAKFKLEQLQITSLEERLTKLKTQIGQRQSLSKQIIERRARELIDGDALKWDSTGTATEKRADPATTAKPNGPAFNSIALPTQSTQIHFTGPKGIEVSIGDKPEKLIAPGRHNFLRHASEPQRYDIGFMKEPDDPEMSFAGLLDIFPSTPETEKFLNHNAVPITITEQDNHHASGGLLIKAIYLPKPTSVQTAIPEIKSVASWEIGSFSSDVIGTANRFGTILAVLRLSTNADLLGKLEPRTNNAAITRPQSPTGRSDEQNTNQQSQPEEWNLRLQVIEIKDADFAKLGIDVTAQSAENFIQKPSRELDDKIAALKKEGKLKVTAEPVLVTSPNRTARLHNGGEFPIPIPQAAGGVTIEWREFGLVVEATSTRLDDGQIRVRFEVSVSERDLNNVVTINGTAVPGLIRRSLQGICTYSPGQPLFLIPTGPSDNGSRLLLRFEIEADSSSTPNVSKERKTGIRLTGPKGLGILTNELNLRFNTEADHLGFAPNRSKEVWQRTMYLNYPPVHEGAHIMGQVDIYPCDAAMHEFLTRNGVTLKITEEDIRGVTPNQLVIKAVYLPKPADPSLAIAGAETIVSTRLDPDKDVIQEATKRGSLIAVLTLGQHRDFPPNGVFPPSLKLPARRYEPTPFPADHSQSSSTSKVLSPSETNGTPAMPNSLPSPEELKAQLEPLAKRVTAAADRVRELEEVYFLNRSNAGEVQKALDELTRARKDYTDSGTRIKPMFDRMEIEFQAVEVLLHAAEGRLEPLIKQVAQGTAKESDLKEALDSQQKLVEKRNNLKKQAERYDSVLNIPGLEFSGEDGGPNRIEHDVPHYSDEMAMAWLEAVTKLKLEFVLLDGLNGFYKAALRVRESSQGRHVGDLIVVLHEHSFESLDQAVYALSRPNGYHHSSLVLNGGLSGTPTKVPFDGSGWAKILSPGELSDAVLEFEVRLRGDDANPERTLYVPGVCVSLEGLFVLPVASKSLAEVDPVLSASRIKGAGSVVGGDEHRNLTLIKFNSKDSKMFSWLMVDANVPSVGKRVKYFRIDPASRGRITGHAHIETTGHRLPNPLRGDDAFIVNTGTSDSVPFGAIVTTDEDELFGIVVAKTEAPEPAADGDSRQTTAKQTTRKPLAVPAIHIEKLVKEYRKTASRQTQKNVRLDVPATDDSGDERTSR